MKALSILFAIMVTDDELMTTVEPDLSMDPKAFYKRHWQHIAESTGHWNKKDLKVLTVKYLNFMREEKWEI